MGQVNLTINGRTYRLSCGDGEEQHLLDLGAHVRAHVEKLTTEHGQIGDERLLLMAALLITDELYEARLALSQDNPKDAGETRPPAATRAGIPSMEAELVPRIPVGASVPPRMPIRAPSAPSVSHVAPTAPAASALPAPRPPTQAIVAAPPSASVALAAVATPALTIKATATVPPEKPEKLAPTPTVAARPANPPATRPAEHLDATALMKGLERKVSRN